MPAQETYEVEQVVSRNEWQGTDSRMVTYGFVSGGQTWKGHTELGNDPRLTDGGTVEGWKNDDGKFGFSKPLRGSSAPSTASQNGTGTGRDDEVGRSIERQTAAKCAAEMAAATPPGEIGAAAMAANFAGFFDEVLLKIQGE